MTPWPHLIKTFNAMPFKHPSFFGAETNAFRIGVPPLPL